MPGPGSGAGSVGSTAGPIWPASSPSSIRRRAAIELGLQPRLGLVDQPAEGRPLLLRDAAQLLHQRREFAVRADIPGLRRLEGRTRRQRRHFRGGLGGQGVQGVLHEREGSNRGSGGNQLKIKKDGLLAKAHPRSWRELKTQAFAADAFFFSASWACFTSALKAASSRTARSARTLRSRLDPGGLEASTKRL